MMGPLQQTVQDATIGRKAQEEAKAKAAAQQAAKAERERAMMREQARQMAEQERVQELIDRKNRLAKAAYYQGLKEGAGRTDYDMYQEISQASEPAAQEPQMMPEEVDPRMVDPNIINQDAGTPGSMIDPMSGQVIPGQMAPGQMMGQPQGMPQMPQQMQGRGALGLNPELLNIVNGLHQQGGGGIPPTAGSGQGDPIMDYAQQILMS